MTAASPVEEPADPPPPPQWLRNAFDLTTDPWGLSAALPLLRAGIEQELREKLAMQLAGVPDVTDRMIRHWARCEHRPALINAHDAIDLMRGQS